MTRSTPEPVDVAVGQRIRERRHVLHLSQTRLAEAVGVTFQQVQKYERGTNRVSASRLSQIARTLHCTVAELHGEGLSGEAFPHGAAEVLAAYEKLPSTSQQALLAFAQALAKEA